MIFQLDTSGGVGPMEAWAKPVPESNRFIFWTDLDPFTQGYVEAMFASASVTPSGEPLMQYGSGANQIVAFSDLAPETLATILKDCADFNLRIGDASHNRGIGATFYKSRQIGFSAHWSLHQAEFAHAFPPLTPTLGDDGKVRFA